MRYRTQASANYRQISSNSSSLALDAGHGTREFRAHLAPSGLKNGGSNARAELLESRCLLSSPVGNEFRVNTSTTDQQTEPNVAMNASGDCVVAWISAKDNQDPHGEIYAQCYDPTGGRRGGEIHVITSDDVDSQSPVVAMDAEGDFVVVWEAYPSQPTVDNQDQDIFAQRFDAAGNKLGGEIFVNTDLALNQFEPAVAMDANGDFVVTWTDQGQGPGLSILAHRYSADGTAQGLEFMVTPRDQEESMVYPSVAMDPTGDYVIAWEETDTDLPDNVVGLFAQRFDANGTALGNVFQVNDRLDYRPYFNGGQNDVPTTTTSMDANGDFVIAWLEGEDGGGGILGIAARVFNSDGSPRGGEFRVNTTQGLWLASIPDVAMCKNGSFVITWDDGQQPDILAREFNSAGTASGAVFRVNAFTQGNQYRSSVGIDDAGDFLVAWDSESNNAASGYDVFAQHYVQAGTTDPSPSSVAVKSSLNPDIIGQPVVFSATVKSANGVPTGKVQFTIDGKNSGKPISLSNGVAKSAANSKLAVGTHTIGAVYLGDPQFQGSSGTLVETISKAPTKIVASSPTLGRNQTFALTAPIGMTGLSTANAVIFYQDKNGNHKYDSNDIVVGRAKSKSTGWVWSGSALKLTVGSDFVYGVAITKKGAITLLQGINIKVRKS